jgi:hypothetical protein
MMEHRMMERHSQLMVVVACPVNHMAMMGTPSSLGQAVVGYRVYRVVELLRSDPVAVNC